MKPTTEEMQNAEFANTNEFSVNINDNELNEVSFKSQVIAYQYFSQTPSVLKIHDVLLNYDVYKAYMRLVSESNYKKYDNVKADFYNYVEHIDIMSDQFTAAVNNVPDNHLHFDNKILKQLNILLSITIEGECIDYIKKNKNNQIKCDIILYYTNADIKIFLQHLKQYSKIDQEKVIDNDSYIALVTKNAMGGLTTQDFAIKNPKMNLGLAYGEEFTAIDKRIFKTITKSDKGLWIFHGPPGTGKSMYIRNLIKRLNKSTAVEDVIYMPAEMIAALESPDFIPFIQEYQDSVLVIEDADLALESRKSNGSIVKTILQLTDGILADCLRLKIIATFNCELSKIDEALQRKGRLQIRHEFRYLTRDEALKLAASLKLDLNLFDTPEYSNKKDWTLAEIYNIQTDFYWDKKQKKLGF